ncbi:hypothetical protein P692DRAFT_20809629 [Suillus brevipes Sb2]|nr:hypothetical protein P692DRAFT_20809629 [Suillus brevipes Sb2]
MLPVLFECNSVEAHIQRRHVDEGQYDLCIDDGKQVTRLTSHEWSNIAAGTKIVMRVIFEQETTTSSGFDYGCHFCGAVNHIAVESIMYSLERRAGCSIDCRKCKRRFQISREPPSANQSTRSSNSNFTGANAEDLEMQLIRNFLVQQSVSHCWNQLRSHRLVIVSTLYLFLSSRVLVLYISLSTVLEYLSRRQLRYVSFVSYTPAVSYYHSYFNSFS